MLTKVIPQNLYSSADVRRIDQAAISSGIPGIHLMKRAGRALFSLCSQRWPGFGTDESECKRYLVICGGGNNAGDGYIFAALAAQKKLSVKLIALVAPAALEGDAKLAYDFALQESVPVEAWSDTVCDDVDPSETIVIDAMLGIGALGAPRGVFAEAVNWVNSSGCQVVSADVPSGVNADTGSATQAVKAELTLTFVAPKKGLYTGRGAALSGEIFCDDLDIPQNIFDAVESAPLRNLKSADLGHLLAPRPIDAHKGLYGHVLIVGGDRGYGGAVAMTAEAALCSGAGLVSVATRPEHLGAILTRTPEVMVTGVDSGQALKPLLERPTTIVIGPGLGQSPWSEQMLQLVLACELPLVVDADALNLLAGSRNAEKLKQRENWIMTPHPGEAARLLGLSVAEVQEDRFAAAEKIQQVYGGVCVLKGAGSIIASPKGLAVARVGNPGMASGGMGDILAGVCGSLVAQKLALPDAVELAVCVHGDAGDLAASHVGERGLRASELIPYIRELLNSVS